MKATLIYHVKQIEPDEDIIEIKIWQVPASRDKPHRVKYSLVYIQHGQRVIGYDNGEGKGDHRHIKGGEEPYLFEGVDKLFEDFYRDIIRIRGQKG